MQSRNTQAELPIHQVAADVITALAAGNVVLQADPGAGKSTVLPLLMLQANLNGRILLLEPRRLAAMNVAARLAASLGEPLGKTIGLRMRGQTVVSKDCKIEVVTEGVLTRILQSDPLLEDIGVVIFDEFHERSLHADLGLALCLDVQREIRSDLRLLLMSATIDSDTICAHLDASSAIRCEVPRFPVEVIWSDVGRKPITQAVADCVITAIDHHTGDALVFLPGVAEIEQTARLLEGRIAGDATLHKLHRQVSADAQAQATAPGKSNQRRIILSTSIAETSITIDGVGIVIDSGIERRSRIDLASGIERLESVMASQASATQRTGRAGRTRAGVCYRLWSESSHHTRAVGWQPEIFRTDLSSLLMEVGQWGAADVFALPWLDKPPAAAIDGAIKLLASLGIWYTDNQNTYGLTGYGRTLAGFGVAPRVAHMLHWANRHGAHDIACALAATLEQIPRRSGVDFSTTLNRLSRTAQRRAGQLQALLKPPGGKGAGNNNDPALLLIRAYPDRVAQRRTIRPVDGNVRYLLSNGTGAVLNSDDPLANSQYLAVAELGGHKAGHHVAAREARIFSALAIDVNLLTTGCADLIEKQQQVEWSDRDERIIAEQRQCLGALVLESKPLQQVDSTLRSQAMVGAIRKKGLSCLDWSEEIVEWQARIERLRELQGSHSLYPQVDDQSLLNDLEHWLLPYLEGVSSLKALKQLNVLSMLKARLDYAQQRELDQAMPLRYRVPSGAEHKLRYAVEGNPVLAVKLQEMFGCRENPSIANGRINLKVELLSPARRAVQVTEDLGNFWHNSYPDVKKDLAGRYPKHPWPDDPLNAVPTAFTKARMGKS